MIAKAITSTPFSGGITASPRRTDLKSVFFKIAKPLFLLLLLPGFLLSAARATPVPGATITLIGGQTLNTFSSDSFTVTFSAAQTGLTASNFTVSGTVTGAFVSNVRGSGTSWTVTVTIPGSFQSQGTFTLNLANSTNLSPGLSGLPIAGPTVQVIAYPLDGSFSLSSTNANSGYAKTGDNINFALTSAHYLLETWDVNIAGQNAAGAINFSPQAAGQVTLGSGTAQGPLAWGWSYTNTFNESNSGSGTSSIIFDSVNPTVSISAPSVSNTGTTPVTYNVTYADANFNTSSLSTSNITLNTTGNANGTIGLTENTPTNYTVTISNITGAGTLGISIAAGTASDMAGNLAPASSPSTTFTVVSAIPTTTSLSANPNPSYTVAPNHTVVFTATVTSSGNTVTSGTVTFTSDGRNIIDIASGQTVVALNGNGTATLNTSFDTVATHKIQATYSGNSTYATSTSSTINQQVILHPTTISSLTASDALVTHAATVNFTATFAKAVTGLTASNFTSSGTGTNNASIGTPTSSDNITWNVPVTTGDDGTLLLTFANATNLSPSVSNTSFNADHSYTVDKTPPTAQTLTYSSSHAGNSQLAVAGDVVSLDFVTSETVQTPSVTIGGHAITPTNISGNEWRATYTTTSGDPFGRIPFSLSFNDLAGNPQPGAPYTDVAAGDDIEFVNTDASLSNITLSTGYIKHPRTFNSTTYNYASFVGNGITSDSVTPTTTDPNATIMVNGIPVNSGSAFAFNNLVAGQNLVTIVVTAQDGSTTQTYTDTLYRALSPNANLLKLITNKGVFTPGFSNTTLSYTKAVPNTVSSITFTPTTVDANATVTVGGSTTASGTASVPQALNVGDNVINIVVTAQDGSSKTYAVTVTRAKSSNDNLYTIVSNHGGLTRTAPGAATFTKNLNYGFTSITLTPTPTDPTATVTVAGHPTASGTASVALPLNVGDNPIDVVVTAQDGVTSQTYTLTVTRAAQPVNTVYEQVAVSDPTNSLQFAEDDIKVHEGLSPNGDGVNDFLLIDGIANHPDNNLQIMNRNGQLVFEAAGYDNSTKVFDGHSNKNGQMQLPGTYFYSLDYTVKGETKHKTGFIVLKY